ncbi:hypothetical protein [Bradyrhizobium sp.]
MTRASFIVASVLALSGVASAQVPMAPAPSIPAWRMPAPTPAVPAPTARAPFGCDARAPNVCHFRIFYTRGDRIVILPAGMKEKKVPVIAGGHYCMTLNKSPAYKCTRKAVNDKYNS